MRYLIAALLLSSFSLAQNTCTAIQSPNLPGPSTNITCSDGSSALVRPLYSLPNISAYSVDVTLPPPVVVPTYVAPPVVQPMPLPALAVQPPTMNMSLMALAIMAKSNQPASEKEVRTLCRNWSKRHGQTYTKRNWQVAPDGTWRKWNWQGVIVDQGTCP